MTRTNSNDMKKKLQIISCVLVLVVMITGCKRQLEDYYADPDKTTNPSIEKLFSSILENNRVRPQYYDLRTMSFLVTAAYSQTSILMNSTAAYQQNMDYTEKFWNDYYTPNNQSNDPSAYNTGNGVMAQYRTMQRLFNLLPIDERENFRIFMNAAKALLLDQTAQMIDLWGDIPYTEAGSLDLSSSIGNAKFQDQRALYDTVITGLKDVADYLAATTLNTNAAASFATQDYVMQGSIDKWRRFVNSLRMRYLMRVSSVPEFEVRVRAEIQEILANPIQFPLVDGAGVGDNYNPANTDILLYQFTNYSDNFSKAFTEISAQAAPDYMLNKVMKPANDPRIPFMFEKNVHKVGDVYVPNAEYRAMPVTYGESVQADSLKFYSIWDSTTYVYNNKLPGVYMSAAEVNFLKAEAFERWGLSGGTAQDSYELAVRQAIAFVYFMYNTNTTKSEALTQPSTATVDAFLQSPTIAYTGDTDTKQEKILTQKWLHFNILQSRQAWAEYRRTRYPKLTVPVSSQVGFELPPKRLIYPTSEVAYNTSYAEIKAKDTRDVKIFWDTKE